MTASCRGHGHSVVVVFGYDPSWRANNQDLLTLVATIIVRHSKREQFQRTVPRDCAFITSRRFSRPVGWPRRLGRVWSTVLDIPMASAARDGVPGEVMRNAGEDTRYVRVRLVPVLRMG
jgi:hypothetical protein